MPTRPWPNPVASRPWPVPSAAATTLHHTSDIHIDYRFWSRGECEHLLADITTGLIPAVHAFVATGDLVDGPSASPPLPFADQDAYALNFLPRAAKGVPALWAVGNHDLAGDVDLPARTADAWALAYNQPANHYVDLPDYRLVTFAADACELTGPWIVAEPTWAWLDTVVAASPTPVVLVEHYPPWEIDATLAGTNLVVQPSSTFSQLVGDHPNVVGMLCGHMHYFLDNPRIASFATIGGRQIPVLCDISSMLSTPGQTRSGAAQIPSTSAYVSMLPDRWEVRYRGHGPHAWTGPGGSRLTTMWLASGAVEYSM